MFVHYVRRVHKITKSDWYIRRVSLSLRMKQLGSQERNFMKFDILVLSKISGEKVSFKYDKSKGYFIWIHIYINEYISFRSSCNEKYFRQKVVEIIRTHLLYSVIFFLLWKLCRLWNNLEKYSTARQTISSDIIWRTLIACSKIKATNLHSEYVILIAFPRQK